MLGGAGGQTLNNQQSTFTDISSSQQSEQYEQRSQRPSSGTRISLTQLLLSPLCSPGQVLSTLGTRDNYPPHWQEMERNKLWIWIMKKIIIRRIYKETSKKGRWRCGRREGSYNVTVMCGPTGTRLSWLRSYAILGPAPPAIQVIDTG